MSRRTSTTALLLAMDRSALGDGEISEVVCDGDDFVLSQAAARVLLRIMRKASARAAKNDSSDVDEERVASRAP